MEPFGLLNFLKFALQTSGEKKEDSSPDLSTDAAQKREETGDNAASASTAETKPADAYLSFLERHERASKRIKKDK